MSYDDDSVRKLGKRINKIYAQANEELTKKVDSFFADFERLDKKKQALVQSGKLSEEEYKRWRKNKLLMGKNYENLRDNIAEQMLDANKIAASYINGELIPAYTHGFNEIGEGAENELSGYSFSLINENAVKRLVTNGETLLPYKFVDGRKDVRWNTKKVNAAILQGLIQGESSKQMAKRLMNVTEMNRASAIRNARTAFTGAVNHGRQDGMKQLQDDGVIVEKEWFASLGDNRTRDAHKELHHVRVQADKPFQNSIGQIMFPGDQNADPANVYNCRCSIGTRIVGFNKQKETDEEDENDFEGYNKLAKEKDELWTQRSNAWDEQYRYEQQEKEVLKVRNSSIDYSQFDRFNNYDDYKAYRESLTKEYEKINDEISELRASKPRIRNYEEGQEEQYEKDREAYDKKYNELMARLSEIENVVYTPYVDWKEVEIYRDVKALGSDGFEKKIKEIEEKISESKRKQIQLDNVIGDITSKINSEYAFEHTISLLKAENVEYITSKKRTVSDIINRIAGGDKTKGSCASLGFCYAAQKAGYDVLDFRGGGSQDIFSKSCKSIISFIGKKNGNSIISAVSSRSVDAGLAALKKAKSGIEYYFTCAQHAAIVRKDNDGFWEYLELQSGEKNGNGWQGLGKSDSTIKRMISWRFGASDDDIPDVAYLIDVDTLGNDKRFINLLGYINTDEGSQQKGEGGHEK